MTGDSFTMYATDAMGFPVGIRLIHCHGPDECMGRICPVHNPTDHHMRGWPAVWRDDAKAIERLCPHGIGHPDPDQFPYWRSINAMIRSTHGCDACCLPVTETKSSIREILAIEAEEAEEIANRKESDGA